MLTPVVLRFAESIGVIDAAGLSHRKIHNEAKPRLGGIAISISFFVPLLGLMVYETKVGNHVVDNPTLIIGFLVGGLMITALGVCDDIYGLSAKSKFTGQIIIATIVSAVGFNIPSVDLPFLAPIQLGYFGYAAAVFWIVAITNAVNLVDGLDGLAAGISLIALTPLTVIALMESNMIMALICFTLTGSLLGFLIFNFHPARIFMGDSGSLFLGYILAIVSVHTATKGGSVVVILTPLLALGLPILDTSLAIARRAWFGLPLFSGDQNHIHHKLMATGMSHRGTVLVLYAVALSFGGLALITYIYRDFTSGLTLAVSALMSAVLIYKVGYLKISSNLQAEFSHTQAIREHNRLIREGMGSAKVAMAGIHDMEAICTKVLSVATLVKACRVSLDLRTTIPAEPVRIWQFTDETELQHRVFSITHDQSTALGQLTFSWPARATLHEGLDQTLDSACDALAADLETLQEHTRHQLAFTPEQRQRAK